MKPVKPEELPKVIGLIVACVVVFGIVFWNLLAPSLIHGTASEASPSVSISPAPAPVAVPTDPAARSGPSVVPIPAAVQDQETVVSPSEQWSRLAVPRPGADPFRMIPDEDSRRDSVIVSLNTGNPPPGRRSPGKNAPTQQQQAVPTSSAAAPTPAPTPPPTTETFELIGLVAGTGATAIVRVDDTQYFAGPNEVIGGMRVIAIKRDGVILRHGKLVRKLTLGKPQQVQLRLPVPSPSPTPIVK